MSTPSVPGSNIGLPDCVEFKARGFRDIYWCHQLNEPVILIYNKAVGPEVRWCSGCNSEMYPEGHTFICTVKKP